MGHKGRREHSVYKMGIWVLMGLAYAYFLHRLDAQSLWYDEAVSARLASMSLPALLRWTAHDIQPPLYYILLHGWTHLVGRGEWMLRYLSLWWGVLTLPLVYVLGRRLSGRPGPALRTLVLWSWAPWLLYYSQETRMYTLLLFWSLAWVYAILRYKGQWGEAVVAGGLFLAGLYTHYFFAFLLPPLLLWHGFVARSWKSFRRLWSTILGMAALGYGVWLPFALQRYRVDASYWRGALKLGEAIRHWWLHMTLGAPEMFLEPEALRWALLFVFGTGLAVILHILTARRSRRWSHVSLLLLWWLLPVGAILLLTFRMPKFHPRYVMIAYPAWILLAGTVSLTRGEPSRWLRAGYGLFLLTLIGWLGLFLHAGWNWFTDPAFTKPDFRGALHHVREQWGKGDILVLVSGHMSPVVEYYAGDLPYVRLPDVDVLDVNQVLDFNIAPTLEKALQGKQGAWLLLWQDEVVDPMGIVPFLLGQAGEEDPSRGRAFWHVRVRYYRLNPARPIPHTPPLTHPVHANLANRVEFLGLYQEETGPLYLFFRALQRVSTDAQLHLEVWDEEDHVWGARDVRAGPYMYPSFRWKPGQIVMARYPFPAVKGTPPGLYTLRVRLYDATTPEGWDVLDAQGRPRAKDVVIPGVKWSRLEPANVPFPPLPPVITPRHTFTRTLPLPEERWGPEGVRGWPPPPWQPGQPIHLQIRWCGPKAPSPGTQVPLHMRGANGVEPLGTRRLLPDDASIAEWPSHGCFFSQWRTRVPPHTRPGVWTWQVVLGGEEFDLFQGEVVSSTRRFTPPPVDIPVDAEFGGAIRLVGVDVPLDRIHPAARVPITVTWQAVKPVDRSYTTFVHIVDAAGQVIAQEDHIPGRGTAPSDGWLPGEVIVDRFEVTLPEEFSPPLWLEVGLYDALKPDMPRVPLTRGEGIANAVRIPLEMEK